MMPKRRRIIRCRPKINKIKKHEVRVLFLCEMGAVRSPALADYFSEWLRKKGIQGIKTESGGGYFAKEKNVELQQDVVVVLGRDLDEGLRVSKESQKIVLTRHEPAEPIFRRVLRTIRRNFEIER